MWLCMSCKSYVRQLSSIEVFKKKKNRLSVLVINYMTSHTPKCIPARVSVTSVTHNIHYIAIVNARFRIVWYENSFTLRV